MLYADVAEKHSEWVTTMGVTAWAFLSRSQCVAVRFRPSAIGTIKTEKEVKASFTA